MESLYVSDLDGTLLGPDGTLSERSRELLRELLDQGLAFTVASARSVASIRPVLAGLRLRLPIIELNGAFLSDLATGRHEHVHAMAPEAVAGVHELIVRHRQAAFVSSFDGADDHLYYGEILNAGMRHYLDGRIAQRDPRLRGVARFSDPFREQVVCLTVIGRRAPLVDLRAAVHSAHGGQVETHLADDLYSGWPWLTIQDRQATKDGAVRTLVERHGLQRHEVVAFGDGVNDSSLLRAADRGIAVANAVDDLKRHAVTVIGPNHEDSVARFIKEEWTRALRGPTGV